MSIANPPTKPRARRTIGTKSVRCEQCRTHGEAVPTNDLVLPAGWSYLCMGPSGEFGGTVVFCNPLCSREWQAAHTLEIAAFSDTYLALINGGAATEGAAA